MARRRQPEIEEVEVRRWRPAITALTHPLAHTHGWASPLLPLPCCPQAEADFLDEDEQASLIAQLEWQAARQRRAAQRLLGAAGLVLAAVHAYFAAQQARHPWTTRVHAELAGVLSSGSIILGELGGAAAVFLAALALQTPSRPGRALPRLLQAAAVAAAGVALFWGRAILALMRLHGHSLGDVWRTLWLPVAAPAYVALAAVMAQSLAAMTRDLAALRAAAYDYKRA